MVKESRGTERYRLDHVPVAWVRIPAVDDDIMQRFEAIERRLDDLEHALAGLPEALARACFGEAIFATVMQQLGREYQDDRPLAKVLYLPERK